MKRTLLAALAAFALAGLAHAAEPQLSHSQVYKLPQLDVTEYQIVKAEEVAKPAAVPAPAAAPLPAPAPAPAAAEMPAAALPAADKPRARKLYKSTKAKAERCVIEVPCIDWPKEWKLD